MDTTTVDELNAASSVPGTANFPVSVNGELKKINPNGLPIKDYYPTNYIIGMERTTTNLVRYLMPVIPVVDDIITMQEVDDFNLKTGFYKVNDQGNTYLLINCHFDTNFNFQIKMAHGSPTPIVYYRTSRFISAAERQWTNWWGITAIEQK